MLPEEGNKSTNERSWCGCSCECTQKHCKAAAATSAQSVECSSEQRTKLTKRAPVILKYEHSSLLQQQHTFLRTSAADAQHWPARASTSLSTCGW
jgi:hypothetical protein